MRAGGGESVMIGGCIVLARHLKQMGSDRIDTMVPAHGRLTLHLV